MEVYVQSYENPNPPEARLEVVKQQVKISDIPPKIRYQLEQKRQLKLMQFSITSGHNQHD
ncbi:hypothetical protein [Anabaena sp. UHCC 0253]|uniref:hypothetical protein n=1 Tax=Anabaena sp. UHCC 0253 TaxID=2590019 RepID=UPI001446A56B|nr:hypothetical protein [Anabaena sp. UHCC 0253]